MITNGGGAVWADGEVSQELIPTLVGEVWRTQAPKPTSLPFLTYSDMGGLPQDPHCSAES